MAEDRPWEKYTEQAAGGAEDGPWAKYGGKSSIPGAPEGLPSSGAAEKIANIIPEEEAATRLKNTGYNRMTSPLSPTEQEAKLNAYNPGGQLMTAATVASGPGLVRSAIRNPMGTAKMLTGSLTAGYAGSKLGERIAGEPGEIILGTLGGLAGGYLGARGIKIPGRGQFIHDLIFGEKPPVDPVRQAVREGRASMIPTRMPAVKAPTTVEPELGSPENPGWVVKLPNRMPVRTTPFEGSTESVARAPRSMVLTPEEAAAEKQMMGVAGKRASERGKMFAGGMVPREGRKVPRSPTKMESTEYPEPRERTRFPK